MTASNLHLLPINSHLSIVYSIRFLDRIDDPLFDRTDEDLTFHSGQQAQNLVVAVAVHSKKVQELHVVSISCHQKNVRFHNAAIVVICFQLFSWHLTIASQHRTNLISRCCGEPTYQRPYERLPLHHSIGSSLKKKKKSS